jgi:hypothetical protein
MIPWKMKSTGTALLITVLLLILGTGAVSGAGFRLSFLDEQPVLDDTCQLLRRTGFSKESITTFKKLVQQHNKNGNRVDKTKFPDKEMGYYRFKGIRDFTDRVTGILADTPANGSLDENTLMCFDVASLLLSGAGCEAPRLEENFASKAVVLVGSNGSTKPVEYSAFLSENRLLYPEKGYEYLVGRPRSEAETRLGLSLRAARHLADGELHGTEGVNAAFAQYIAALKRDGFVFPRGFKVGLGLYVNPKFRYIMGDHAFLCFPGRGRLICLEKNGAKGPYVRAEFASKLDLGRYVSWSLLRDANDPKEKEYGCAVLVSINDQLIGSYRPAIQP